MFKLAHSCEALVRSWKCVRITAALPGSRNWRAVNVQPECRLLACCNYLLIPYISSLHPVVSLMECVLHSVATSPTRWRPLIAYPFAACVLYIFISIHAWDLQVTKNCLFSLNQVFSHEICLSLRLHNQNPSFELLFWGFLSLTSCWSLSPSLSLSYKHPSFSPKFCGLSALFTSAVLTLPTSILLTEDWGSTKRITIMSLRTPGLPPPINKWGSNTQSETGNGICALPLKWF